MTDKLIAAVMVKLRKGPPNLATKRSYYWHFKIPWTFTLFGEGHGVSVSVNMKHSAW